MKFSTLVLRALRLRCPRCGTGRLFRNWFIMEKNCGDCDLLYERESGFFLGAIYFNYGLTAIVITVAYPLLFLTRTASSNVAFRVCMAFAILFPILFFPFSRSLWLGFDFWIDPRKAEESKKTTESKSRSKSDPLDESKGK